MSKNKNGVARRNLLKAMAIAGVFGAGYLTKHVETVLTQAPTKITITPQSFVQEASYIIFIDDDGLIKARNGKTGQIDFQDRDAATVIQSAIDALTSGGKIFIKEGIYIITKTININNGGIVLEGVGMGGSYLMSSKVSELKLADGANCHVIYNNAAHNAIKDLLISGNRDNQTSTIIDGIYNNAWELYIDEVYIFQCKRYGLHNTVNSRLCRIGRVFFEQCSSDGVYDEGTENIYVGATAYQNGSGFHIVGKYCQIVGCYATISGFNGIRIGGSYNLVVGNIINNAASDGLRIDGGVGNIVHANQILNASRSTNANRAGIFIMSSTNNIITNNYIASPDFTDPSQRPLYGIWLYTNTDKNLIMHNWIQDYTSVAIYIVSGTHKIKYNVGYVTENSGTATFSGDGTTTQFKIAHGLARTPKMVNVIPASSDAKGTFYVTVDDTYIYVNYATAPPAGTNNVALMWSAEM